MTDQKRCFVVMGFGTKTDLATGRKLNLDKSYQALIKPVVEAKGLQCIRADEIKHSGTIDVPMYQQLLMADVVVADISTANPNAFYELGLRHALRPRTTIVISEEQLCYPFDLNHVYINKYTHLGENIDYFEVLRFQKLLGETLDKVLQTDEPDSPVYTFLDDLIPPSLQKKAEQVARQVGDAIRSSEPSAEVSEETETLALLVKQGEEALKKKQFALSKSLFQSAYQMVSCGTEVKPVASNSYLIHRLALATYKAKLPNEVSALNEAISILDDLDLSHTNDSETVVLAGKIEKRLYFNGLGEEHLANAILYYERAFYLLHNRYNGINLAFLINNRVASNLYTTEQDKIADMILANRIRQTVLQLCEKDWTKLERKSLQAEIAPLPLHDDLAADQQRIDNEQRFWILVNKAEAHFGLGEMAAYKAAWSQAEDVEHSIWMMKAFTDEVEKLRILLRTYGHLLPGGWSEVEETAHL